MDSSDVHGLSDPPAYRANLKCDGAGGEAGPSNLSQVSAELIDFYFQSLLKVADPDPRRSALNWFAGSVVKIVLE